MYASSPMRKFTKIELGASRKWVLLISILASVVGLAMVFHPISVYRSAILMDAYFGGEVAPGTWTWNGSWTWEQEPFRYRLLFHAAVDGLANFMTLVMPRSLSTYWFALLAAMIASIVFAAVALELLLRQCGYDRMSRALLLIAWFLMPPIHNAFVLPVQTKEDFLAYGILFLGLRSVLREDLRGVLWWTLLGALTRETLLILPGVYFLVSRDTLLRRAFPIVLGLGVSFGIRIVMGMEGYQVTRNENFESALLVPVSLFFVFGFAWLAAPTLIARAFPLKLLRLILQSFRPGGTDVRAAIAMQRLLETFPIVLILLLSTHVFMGRVVEIRISALLAPWLLVGLAGLLAERDLRVTPVRLVLPAAVALIIAGLEASGIAGYLGELLQTEIYGFVGLTWGVEFYLQLLLLSLLLPFALLPADQRPSSRLRRAD